MTADQALQELMAGNGRFVCSQPLHPRQDAGRRRDVAKGQRPIAVILGCADSRVPPELIFDQGVGDLFVVRTAGHVPDRAVLGSIELGVQEFEIPLIMVLGHSRCGAVTLTIESIEKGHDLKGDMRTLREAIARAVENVKGNPGDLLENAVRANVRLTMAKLNSSQILAKATEQGRLRIVGARYDLDTGIVEILKE